MSAQPTDFNHRRWRYHNFQFFTLHFQLKKPSSQMQGRHKDVVPPWFAFIGGDCHGRRRPRNDTINASKRNNGRSRGSLPIDIPTPRPCSAAFFVPPRTYRGSLNASVSVLSYSQFFTYNPCIIAIKRHFCQHPRNILFVGASIALPAAAFLRFRIGLRQIRQFQLHGRPMAAPTYSIAGFCRILFCQPQSHNHCADAAHQLGDDHRRKHFRRKSCGESHMIAKHERR